MVVRDKSSRSGSCLQTVDKLSTFQKVYVIAGKPIPLARPRMSKGYVYDSQKQSKQSIATLLRRQHGLIPMYCGPLHLNITFYMPIPKRTKAPLYHRKKPDLSNMIKFYEDVSSGILYADDRQIVKIFACKIYDENPRTEFTITELKENNV